MTPIPPDTAEVDYKKSCTPLYSDIEQATQDDQWEPIIRFLGTGCWPKTGFFTEEPVPNELTPHNKPKCGLRVFSWNRMSVLVEPYASAMHGEVNFIRVSQYKMASLSWTLLEEWWLFCSHLLLDGITHHIINIHAIIGQWGETGKGIFV